MNNGNDLPARTSNLEFSDENRKSLNSGLNSKYLAAGRSSIPECTQTLQQLQTH